VSESGVLAAEAPEDGILVHINRRAQFLTLGAVMLGMLLGSLDQTIVGTAMPKIVNDLNGFQRYSWVITAYLVASTAMMPIFGKISDIFGRKWLYMLGIATFLLGSMLSGLSQSMEQLILFRAIQGLGAGMMTPIAMAIIGDIFPPAERGKYQGLIGAVFGLAVIVGPQLGGFITDNIGWRWVFYVNLPVAILAFAVVFLVFPSHTALHKRHSIDWLGSVALIGSVVPLLMALSLGSTNPDNSNSYAWTSPQIVGLFALAIVFGGAFLWIQSRAAEPTIPLDLFRNRIFNVSMIIVFLTSMGMFGAVLYIPLFVQDVLMQSATNSGLVLTPMMIGVILVSIISGYLMSRTGHYKILAIVGTFGVLVGLYLLSTMTVSTDNGTLVRFMIVLGLGLGSSMALFTIVVQNAFPVDRLGVVTASLAFFRSIGGAVGVAVLGSAMNNRFASEFQTGLQSLPVALRQSLAAANPAQLMNAGDSDLRAQMGAQAAGAVESVRAAAIAPGIAEIFLIGAGLVAIAFVASFFLKEIPLRKTRHDVPPVVVATEESVNPALPMASA
jgi:EmrB/QacA subfamily drug resistance transporter